MRFEPRGGNQKISGIPWLARMADKARAKAQGSLGDYDYPCPRDQRLLQRLGLTADQFTQIVLTTADDRGIIEYIQRHYSQ